MKEVLARKFSFFAQRMTATFLACMFWMVEGDLRLIKPTHWLIGFKTAFVSATLLLLLSITDAGRFMNSFAQKLAITAIVVALADHFVHPGHFGSEYTEAIITGITAASLVVMIGLIQNSLKL